MSTPRRSFRRASEEERRADLISATQECIIQGGIGAATTRKIADIAGVTPGLLRHYFPDKTSLLRATYQVTMSTMTQQAVQVLEHCESTAAARLRLFIETSLKPPVMQPRNHKLWASFTSLMNAVPEISNIHREAYLEFRNVCEALITEVFIELGRELDTQHIKRLSIAVNALIDGLWVEGCMAIELFDQEEFIELGVSSVQSLLKLETL
ncbi:MAG: TetR family transcriptional regulator C-terminal domain-containing protein [Oceanospirillaceae bacterium]